MPKTLLEYAESLDARTDLRWPSVAKRSIPKATPYLKPLRDIRCVLWSPYGTLMRIADGELLQHHPTELRMEVALDKTIQEFRMWASMTRKPGAPWRQLCDSYLEIIEDLRLTARVPKGEPAEVSSAAVWRKIVSRLEQKEFVYDRAQLGDEDSLSEKIALFFHASLQGVELTDDASATLGELYQRGMTQGLLGDGQCFTRTQLERLARRGGSLPALSTLLPSSMTTLSYEAGVRRPGRSLYAAAVERAAAQGIEPSGILYVSSKVATDLGAAKAAGMRTALFAGDALSLSASSTELRDPKLAPDRLITEPSQLLDIIG